MLKFVHHHNDSLLRPKLHGLSLTRGNGVDMNNSDGNTAQKKPVLTRVERLVDEVFDSLDPSAFTKAGRSRRSPTLLKLEWLGERLRRAESIKAKLAEGTYSVSSEAVARKMLNLD